MSDAEKELMAMIFDWLDTLGPGIVTFDIDASIDDDLCWEIIRAGNFAGDA